MTVFFKKSTTEEMWFFGGSDASQSISAILKASSGHDARRYFISSCRVRDHPQTNQEALGKFLYCRLYWVSRVMETAMHEDVQHTRTHTHTHTAGPFSPLLQVS